MSWKDNLLPGSFRGVPFHILSHEYSAGRNTSIFYLLYGDKDFEPVIEDSGPESDEFTIDAFIIQNTGNNFDYFPARDNFIAALKKYGPGLLVHPYLGEVKVSVLGKFSMRETSDEGGIARFSITFVKAVKKDIRRTSESDSTVEDKKDEMNEIAADNFAEQYESGGVFQQESANAITSLLENITEVTRSIQTAINTYVSEATGVISSLIQDVDDVIDSPCDIATSLLNAATQIFNVIGLGAETITGGIVGGCSGVRRNEQIFDGEYITERMGTTTIDELVPAINYDPVEDQFVPEEQVNNIVAITDMNSIFLIGVGCLVLIKTDFDSQEKLLEYMNFFADTIDGVLDRIGEEDTDIKTTDIFNALQDLRNVFVNEMLIKNTTVAKTIEYIQPAETKSLLQWSYDLYQDLDRCCDLYDRNKPVIKHPGFPPGGEVIRALSE